MSRAKTITVTACSLAAGAMLATGITGIASATGTVDSTPNPAQSSAPADSAAVPDRHSDGPRGGRHGGGHGMQGGPAGDALHGEAVVKAADGTISTVRMIHGTVTAVDASSISVKAEDGFTATYVVTSTTVVHTGVPDRGQSPEDAAASDSTIVDVKVGDVAMVEGTVSGSTVTANHVRSMTAAQAAQMEQLRAQHEQQASTESSTTTPTSVA